MVDRGMRKCSAGACPPLGSAWGVADPPPCRSAVPSHNSGFSYLGVPASAGMSDCYKNRLPTRHSGESRSPGVGRGKTTRRWKKTDTSPHFHPLMRTSQVHGDSGESRNPGVEGWHRWLPNVANNQTHFHILVCRPQPACAIAMKACPGLRSGIDRSGSLSFAIRGIPSSIRPPIRHYYENTRFRQPEG